MDETIIQLLNSIEEIKAAKGRIDIVEIANRLGIKVYSTKEIQQSSFIAYDPDTKHYSIYLNSKEAGPRQRFSVAHEIAHFLLHKEKIITFGAVGRECDISLSIKEEKEADNLAGMLLMPENSVIDTLNRNDVTIYDKIDKNVVVKVAKEFDVSIIAATLRLRELGYYVGYIEM